jgi:hypothetical protein
MNTDTEKQARDLSDAWDRLLQSQNDQESGNDLLQVVAMLNAEHQKPGLSVVDQDAIWSAVLAGTVTTLEMPESDPTRLDAPRQIQRTLTFVYRYAWIIVAGMVGGFVAGVSSRLTMRLAGYLTIGRNRHLLTDNDARVGEITLGGTVFLGMVGAALGVLGLILYVIVRDRFPFAGWRRAAAFAALLLIVFGYVVMDPSNPDYHQFGPAWLNILTFSSLYLIMGFCVVQIYEWGLRFASGQTWQSRGAIVRAMQAIVSIALCIVGTVLTFPALFVGATAILIPLLAFVCWTIGSVVKATPIRLERMPTLARQWGIWVVPGIVGFTLTARGVTEILMNR